MNDRRGATERPLHIHRIVGETVVEHRGGRRVGEVQHIVSGETADVVGVVTRSDSERTAGGRCNILILK